MDELKFWIKKNQWLLKWMILQVWFAQIEFHLGKSNIGYSSGWTSWAELFWNDLYVTSQWCRRSEWTSHNGSFTLVIYYAIAIANAFLIFSHEWIGITIAKTDVQPNVEPNGNRNRIINRRCEWYLTGSDLWFESGPTMIRGSPAESGRDLQNDKGEFTLIGSERESETYQTWITHGKFLINNQLH